MLEAPGQVAHRPGELGLDSVASARRGRRVMGFVQDQQAARRHRTEPLPHGVGVRRVRQQSVRHQETAVGAPRIDAEAALPSHPRDVGPVQDLEDEAEPLFHLPLPLLQHRGRRGDHDRLRLLAQQELAGDQAGLHGLAQPRVVGDEQVDPRQAQRLAQGLHLVGVEADAGPERRLDQPRVGGGDAVPAEGVEEGGKATGVVEAPLAQRVPALVVEDPAVQFALPEDLERLALGVVVGAGQADDRRAAGLLHRLDQPLTGPHPHQLPGLRRSVGKARVHQRYTASAAAPGPLPTASASSQEPAWWKNATVLLPFCHHSTTMMPPFYYHFATTLPPVPDMPQPSTTFGRPAAARRPAGSRAGPGPLPDRWEPRRRRLPRIETRRHTG